MKRLLFRICYYPLIWILKPINVINPRLYMRLYTKLLKALGLNMTGMPRYISTDVYFDNFSAITLSERTVISKRCVFLTHDYSPTTAFFTPPILEEYVKSDVRLDGHITIHENVFIGLGTTILPNTDIGRNCIIGAGSVVKGTIPDGSVVVGNPAKVLCSIYDYKKKCMNRVQSFIWD